ncbi:MAG: preprotein translocase subunit SecY [Eubacterium sp.]|nr:preprotein translocase subunit SecY [Eubacterium sp.]
MLQTVRNAFKIEEIRKRLFFTFLMLIVVRIGAQLPLPGLNHSLYSEWMSSQTGDAFNFFDSITGGSFEDMSILALNITPYITASIIMQLLTIAIPKLEELHKEGEEGRKKISSITRYLTIGLSVLESLALAIGFGRQGYLDSFNAFTVIMMVTCLTAGSAVLMWIGERITENGIGNGISIVLTINIISRLPNDFAALGEQFVMGQNPGRAIVAIVIIAVIVIGLVVSVVFLQDGQRKIPVQYSRKIQGRRQVGGQSTFLPLRVNTAGVIPIIFAQSLMQTPVIIGQLLGANEGTGIGAKILKGLSQSNWCDPAQPVYTIGLIVYILLIVAFAYFYTSITFNPLELADNMKKQGGFIPGIRPGKPTSDYLTQILGYVIFIGAVALSIIAFIPIFFNGVFGASVSFGGTSIIIIVGVIIETIKQVESMMVTRHYTTGFLGE